MAEALSKTTNTAYIGIGSNQGDKLENCLKAIDLTGRIEGCRVKACSDFFQTEPVGVEGHDWYVNGVMELYAGISAPRLLKGLLAIEAGMGRVRRRKWGPRPIDLDLLLYGRHVISKKDLTVPHRFMHVRRFVLVPMVQLAPDLIHPVLKRTMAELLESLPEDGQEIISLPFSG
jgi:2-amino-4-hydroxy-6-hydroxymethyldihydropteridine diphosphokinase